MSPPSLLPAEEQQRRIRILLLLLLLKRRRYRRIRRTRLYVRGLNSNRLIDGDFATLVTPMRNIFFSDHFDYFRMNPSRFELLLRRVAPFLFHAQTHRMPISIAERLAITIRFLASGDSLASVAYGYRIGRATATTIIRETTKAIYLALNEEFLALPTRQRWKHIADDFSRKWNFPLCIGAIDGKHVAIKDPPHSGSLFRNYKGFFSIILLALVDANYNFIYVNVGDFGGAGDAGVFNESSLGRRMSSAKQSWDDCGMDIPYDTRIPGSNVVAPHVFLGDQAFALHRHLLTPYKIAKAGSDELVFNYRLSRARRVVENAFGILSTRWRVLEKRIDVGVAATEDVVIACVLLHNYLMASDSVDHHNQPRYSPPNYVDFEDENGNVAPGEWRKNVDETEGLLPFSSSRRCSSAEYLVREKFKAFFKSDVGKLPWQDDYVYRTY